MTAIEIPLFPLRTVLFPGAELPLRIFEPRYQAMTRELLSSGGCFGVLLIRAGKEVTGDAVPYDVGTTAAIEDSRELNGGRFAISARGAQRFRLKRMLEPRPYPYGEVELIDDSNYDSDRRLNRALETVRATFPAYFRLALALTDQWARGIALPKQPHDLVNLVAPWLQVEEEVRQKLLEIESAGDRIAQLAEVLDELLARTRSEVLEHRRKKFDAFGTRN